MDSGARRRISRQLSSDFVVSVALDREVNPVRAGLEFYRLPHPFRERIESIIPQMVVFRDKRRHRIEEGVFLLEVKKPALGENPHADSVAVR